MFDSKELPKRSIIFSSREMTFLVRDILDAFRALAPPSSESLHSGTSSSTYVSPSDRAAVFWNDCHLIAHHLVTLAHHHALKGVKDPLIIFVDMIPGFRSLGETHFRAHMVCALY